MMSSLNRTTSKWKRISIPGWTLMPTLAVFVLATVFTAIYAPGWVVVVVCVVVWAVVAPIYFAGMSAPRRRR